MAKRKPNPEQRPETNGDQSPKPKPQNPHAGHRQRLKQEFLEKGMDHFPPHKALELMLFYPVLRADTNEIAHALIDRFGSLSSAIEAPRELLLDVEGVGPEAATFLKALQAFSRRYLADQASATKLDDHETAKAYVRAKFLGDSNERVFLLCLGMNHRLLQAKEVAQGTPDSVNLSASHLTREALLVSGTKKVMLAHNHPHGICNPSRRDIQVTIMLLEAFRQIDLELVDHLIVGSDDVCSMDESGMMPRPQPPVKML